MDLRQLRYFVEIVEQGSITGAARRLNVAQPALSLHLKTVEEQLGTRLLDRGRSGVTPTEAGLLLARRARMILDDLARVEEDVRGLDREPRGLVRIGLPGTISGIVTVPLLMAARDRFPAIRLTIAEAMSGFIADWMGEGRVDLAVLYARSPDEGIGSEPLLEEELVILAPPDRGHGAEVDLAALADEALVLPSAAHGLRRQIDAALVERGLSPRIAVEIDSYSNIKQLVAAGFGASILPVHAVAADAREGRLAVSRIAAPGLWRGAHLASPSGRPMTRAQQAVRHLLREVVADLVAGGHWAGARAVQAG
ncbi:LysR family transcriptional regulator [Aliigemmobacter aestuarii]|uniref:LysR family transcriptional regulator n=1 Tax=Aliigemmobacter aestuarii TaxID=1445661 RepID=A0A4S3MQB0_9RHOB|nr:LysR substrate-binding domain-containing protein [Gemmobacter aestuarii]THD84696.1 LysR family transcriptional regulator [Gemmobacter aestuarii]